MGQVFSECGDNFPMGLIGLDQITWSGQAGAFYECWKLSPCCGSPDAMGVILCILHWTCISPCSACKLYASSLGDQCSLWPHCVFILLCPVGRLFTRYNLRKKNGTAGNMCGDAVCCLFCPWCSCAQELRSVDPGAWRIVPECDMPGIFVPGCKFLN